MRARFALLSGIFFGAAAASKWSVVPVELVLILAVLAIDAHRSRKTDLKSKRTTILLGLYFSGLFAIASTTVYITSWFGWLNGLYSWGSYLSDYPPGFLPPVLSWIPLEWQPFVMHHIDMFTNASTISSNHKSITPAWQWPLMLKPTILAYENITVPSCLGATNCVAQVSAISSPIFGTSATRRYF